VFVITQLAVASFTDMGQYAYFAPLGEIGYNLLPGKMLSLFLAVYRPGEKLRISGINCAFKRRNGENSG